MLILLVSYLQLCPKILIECCDTDLDHKTWCGTIWNKVHLRLEYQILKYRKVVNSNTSRLRAHAGLFRLLMKEIFDPYVLWQKVVTRIRTRDYTVCNYKLNLRWVKWSEDYELISLMFLLLHQLVTITQIQSIYQIYLFWFLRVF